MYMGALYLSYKNLLINKSVFFHRPACVGLRVAVVSLVNFKSVSAVRYYGRAFIVVNAQKINRR